MSFGRRTCCLSLLLAIGLLSAGSLATPVRASTSDNPDEETIRVLTERYGVALTSGDLEKIREYWKPGSKHLSQQLRTYQKFVSETRIEFLTTRVSRLEVMGERAVSQLTVDERRTDRKTGALSLTYGTLHGACRSYEWIRTSAGWKIERESLFKDELAAKLEKVSELERDQLLEKERAFVTNTLLLALSGRGLRHNLRGDFELAARCFLAQKFVAEKLGDKVGVAGSLLNIALTRFSQDELEVALQYGQQALEMFTAIGLPQGQALAFEKLATFYRIAGDHRRAFDCAQKSLRLMEQVKLRRGIVEGLIELALIYGTQNNAEQAIALYERALPLAQDLGDKILVATMRHDLAIEYVTQGKYEHALEIYQQLLKQTESFGDQGGAAMVRHQMGLIYFAKGEYATALGYYEQSLSALESLKMKRATGTVWSNISDVYLAQRRFGDAFDSASRAVSLARETGRPSDLWAALTSLGYAQLELNRNSEARTSLEEAVSIIEKLRTQTAGGAEECQRYFGSGLRAHQGLLRLLVKENKAKEALLFAERARARALLDMLLHGHVNVQKAMTAAEREQEWKLKLELAQLNRQLNRSTQSDPAVATKLEKARLNYEAFQNSLYTAHPELKVQRGEAPTITAGELVDLVPDARTALLEYVVGADETYLFVTTKNSRAEVEVRVYTIPIKRDALARETGKFLEQLAARDLGFRTSSSKLYELLMKPAVTQLRSKTNFIIAPDDSLWDLPFQALLTSSNRFLIEDGNVAYTPSLTVLREMTRRRNSRLAAHASPATLLAIGNPTVGNETANGLVPGRRSALDPLPEAEQEVKALGRLYGASRSRIYVGAEAREDRLKSQAGQAKILHFATHGMLNDASPMYSNLALAQGGTNEDGLLEAWELMQLDLKADLAVLSACETARGRVGAGEGMIGFSWAMFIAGVPSIVVSQWKVESAGTRELMVNFHRALISSSESTSRVPVKAEALRQASLKLMKNPQTSHPFYWAGFVLVGDGR